MAASRFGSGHSWLEVVSSADTTSSTGVPQNPLTFLYSVQAGPVAWLESVLFAMIGAHGYESRSDDHGKENQCENEIVNHT